MLSSVRSSESTTLSFKSARSSVCSNIAISLSVKLDVDAVVEVM
jgi:hypothetical protein